MCGENSPEPEQKMGMIKTDDSVNNSVEGFV